MAEIVTDGSADRAALPKEPAFCPFCGKQGTLKPCDGAGFVEMGCYIGDTYCYEGNLPGRVCESCGGEFSLDVDEDAIHENCACHRSDACECGRRQESLEEESDDAA